MQQVFIRLVHMSLTAGWLVLAVLLLRVLLRRAPRRIVCLLWALVALRLICPILIETRFSLVPRTESVVQQVQTVFPGEDAPQPDADALAPADTSARTSPDMLAVLSRVWLVGVIGMLAAALWSDLRLRRRLRVSLPQSENVRLCDGIDTPFVLGILRPRIYLPAGIDPEAAEYVLMHERAHIARRDHWWKPLGWVLLSVYWFHPLLWLGYVLLCRDLELACDEHVARNLDREGLAAYSEALLRCSAGRSSLIYPVAFGENDVKERVKSILRYQKPTFRRVLIALIVVIIVAVLFLTDRPAQGLYLPDEFPVGEETDTREKEAAWTVQLANWIDAGELPQPTPTPTPTPAATQNTAAGQTYDSYQSTPTQSTAQTAEETWESEIEAPIVNMDMPPMYSGQQTTPTAPPSSFQTTTITPMIAGADYNGNVGPSSQQVGVVQNGNTTAIRLVP